MFKEKVLEGTYLFKGTVDEFGSIAFGEYYEENVKCSLQQCKNKKPNGEVCDWCKIAACLYNPVTITQVGTEEPWYKVELKDNENKTISTYGFVSECLSYFQKQD